MKRKYDRIDSEIAKILGESMPVSTPPPTADDRILSMIAAETKPASGIKQKSFFTIPRIAVACITIIIGVVISIAFLKHSRQVYRDTGLCLTESNGEVNILRNSETIGTDRITRLKSGDTIKTGGSGKYNIILRDAIVKINGKSSLRINELRDSSNTVFISRLHEGLINVHTKKLNKNSLITIQTYNARISVRGTSFSVYTVSGKITRVSVSDGKVLIENKNNETAIVEAHQEAFVYNDNKIRIHSITDNKKKGTALQSATVRIYASQKWQKTGIFAKKGDTVHISASGTVTVDGSDFNEISPDGKYIMSIYSTIMPQTNFGTLILRVGDTVLSIGSGKTFYSDCDGEVEMCINDCAMCYDDNKGSFVVNIAVEPGKK
jgi:hypothetical protein